MQPKQGERHAEGDEHLHVRHLPGLIRRERERQSADKRRCGRARHLARKHEHRDAVHHETDQEQRVVGDDRIAGTPH